jgi:hypothetical protein
VGDPLVVAGLLIAAATAALVARLAFWLGGRAGKAVLAGGLVALLVANLTIEAFDDAGRVLSGATIGFTVGAVIGVIRYGMPPSRRSRALGREGLRRET